MYDMYSVIAAVASAFFAGLAAYQTYKGHKRNSIENGAPRFQIKKQNFPSRVLITSNGIQKYKKSLIEVEVENIGDIISPKCFIFITIPNEKKDKHYISRPLYSLKKTHLEKILVEIDCPRDKILISVVAQDMFENLFVYDSHISLNNKHLYTFNSKPILVNKTWNRKYYNKIIDHMNSAYESNRFLSGYIKDELSIYEYLSDSKKRKKILTETFSAEKAAELELIKIKEKFLIEKLCQMKVCKVDLENYEIS